MKNSLKLFLLLCLLLAVSTLSASEKVDQYPSQLLYMVDEEPHIPFIDLLKDGESYQIEIVSLGCFSGSKQTLAIFRKANGYAVHFGDTIKDLNTSDIDVLRDFEVQLQSLPAGGCSTVDTYKLVYGSDIVQVSDGTCSFNGGSKLMRQLGLISSK